MKRLGTVLTFATTGILLASQASHAIADGADIPSYSNTLVAALDTGEREGHEDFLKLASTKDADKASSDNSNPEPAKSTAKKDEPDVNALIEQVDRLKSKVVMVRANTLSTQNPRDRKKIGSTVVYTYQDGKIFELHAGVDQVTDITLQPYETLTNSPVSGDTVRWKIAVINSGTEKGPVTHLIVKPLEEDIETNIIITTDRRTYHLRAVAGDWYMPTVSWSYPDDEAKLISEDFKKRQESEPLKINPDDLNFGYSIEGDESSWKPLRVFDDGMKTFFHMPKSMATAEAPALFAIEDDEPQLVNYRVKGDYYILDRLIQSAELRVGERKKIRIYSDKAPRSIWERIF